jgi:hypothetical protein
MQLHPLALTALPPALPAGGSGSVFLIGKDADCADALTAPALAALAGADVVPRLHRHGDPGLLALVTNGTEWIPDQFAAAGSIIHLCTDPCAHEARATADKHAPQPLATAFSGLAC